MAILIFFILIALPNFVGAVCNDPSNICQLDSYTYTPAKGYDCFQIHGQQQFMCTCHGNRFTMNAPCRCTSAQMCGTGSNVLGCVDQGNSEYVCVCKTDQSVDILQNKPCGSATTVTPVTPATSTTSTQPPVEAHFCLNNGVHDPSIKFCHCPSGFSGRSCERFDLERACDRVVCKNGGRCTYGYGNGTYFSKCICPKRFEGEYCQEELTLGTCQYEPWESRSCNGYICNERAESDGQTYFKCGACPVTTWGARCTARSDIPQCQREGDTFVDAYMHEQGKYFACGEANPYGYHGIYRNSCPKGLRYNANKKLCVLPEYA